MVFQSPTSLLSLTEICQWAAMLWRVAKRRQVATNMKIWCCFLWKPRWLFYLLCVWGYMSHTFSVFTVHVTPFLASYHEYFHHPYIYLLKKPQFIIYYLFNNDASPFFSSLAFFFTSSPGIACRQSNTWWSDLAVQGGWRVGLLNAETLL